MAVTDIALLTAIQYHVVEPNPDGGVTWALGDWTAATVINYLNQRQDRFLRETGIVVQRDSSVNTVPNVSRYELPDTLLQINRVSWEGPTATITELPRADTWQFDHGYADWTYNTAARPQLYTEYETPQRVIEIAPASYDNGVIHLLYVAAGETLSNTGVTFTVPDECVPILMWGTLADMLSESARVQDAQRATYCEARYHMGVEATLLLLNSWS